MTAFGKSATSNVTTATALGGAMASVGTTLSYAVTGSILALGTAAVASGLQLEGAFNTIARKTGETGTSLAGLKKDFEAVFVTVPNSAQEVAAAIADVHQRLGLTGVELQSVTKKFIDFANVNQIDVADATRTVSTLMGALSENTNLTAVEIGNASNIMDKLTYASQQSGASVGKLAQGVIQGGIAFVEMGFGLDESIALFTQFEKVGANVTDVTSSLHRTMGNLAKSGVTDLAGAFKSLVTEIKDAPKYADSVRLSIEAFGMKAGPKLAEEIRAGTYSIDELANTLKGLQDTTKNAAKNSESFTESLGILRNQISVALAPIGIQLLGVMRELLPVLIDAAKLVANVTEWFVKLPAPVKAAAAGVVALLAAVGPLLVVLGPLVTSVATLAGPAALGALASSIGSVALALPALVIAVAAVTAVVVLGYQAWMLYKEHQERAAGIAQQVITDQNNLARVIKATGQEFKSMEEATAWMIKNDFAAKLRAVQPAAEAAAQGINLAKDRIEKMISDAMQPLSEETKRNIEKLDGLGFSVDEIAKNMTGVAEPAIKRYVDQLDKSAKALKKAGEEQKDFKELVYKTNAEILKGMATWDDFTKKIEVSTKRIADSIISNDAIMRSSQNELNDFVHESMVERVTFELFQLDKLAYNTKLKLDENVANYKAASDAIDALIARRKESVRLADEIDTSDDAFNGLTKNIESSLKNSLKNIGNTILDAVKGGGSVLGSVGSSIGMALGEDLSKSLSGFLTKHLGSAVGDAVGAMLPGIGALLGPALQALGGGLKKLFGIGINEEVKKANDEIFKVKESLIATYGPLQDLEVMSQRVGISFVEAWGHQGKDGLKQMNDLVDEFKSRLEAVSGAVKKVTSGFSAVAGAITEPWRDLGDQMKKTLEDFDKADKALSEGLKSGKGSVEQLQTAWDKANDAQAAVWRQIQTEIPGAKQQLADLGIQAIATFSAAFLASGSYAEALAAVAPAVNNLADSYKALGIESDNVLLKNLMIQSQVLESSPQLIAAIDGQAGAMQGMAQMGLLNAETFAAMQRTGTELYMRLQGETALAALASGDLGDQTRNALLPMQAYLQQAATQAHLLGLPLDENTQRLIDQSKELGIWKDAGVSAQDKLIEGMQGIVTKLDELLARLGSFTSGLTNLPSPTNTVTTNYVARYQDVHLSPVFEPGAEPDYRAGGGMVPRGTDTVPAMLTPGERVLTTSENDRYEREQNDGNSNKVMEATLAGIRRDLQRNNDTIRIELQSMLAQLN